MTVAARSIRKLMWFSCFTSSGGPGLVGLGKEIKRNHKGNIFSALCVFNCRNSVLYFKKILY